MYHLLFRPFAFQVQVVRLFGFRDYSIPRYPKGIGEQEYVRAYEGDAPCPYLFEGFLHQYQEGSGL